jgi:hypothetical protein
MIGGQYGGMERTGVVQRVLKLVKWVRNAVIKSFVWGAGFHPAIQQP